MKKGQAALEFLMTYGWAILVVLIVIGALAYFGVLNPNTFVSERCNLPSPFVCSNSVVKVSGPSLFAVTNSGGSEVKITGLKMIQTGSGETSDPECIFDGAATPVAIKSGETSTITTASCTFIDVGRGSKAKFNLELKYYATESGSSFEKTVKGDMVSTLN